MDALDSVLHGYGIEILDDRKDFSEIEGRGYSWRLSPIWTSWATILDGGTIAFYLPETHSALTTLTGIQVDYIRTRFIGSTMTLFLVGYYEGELPFGPFWSEDFTANIDQLSSQMRRKLSFAKDLQEVLNSCESKNNWSWFVSYKEAMGYFLVHRGTVIEVGKLLDIDMNDHDVTKTHIVQIALGFLWHWPGDRTPSESQLMGLALDTIRAGHLEIENHHPEFECANAGLVDIHKLFTDRVCVHLQKDPKDDKNGWDINVDFIPMIYRDEWFKFGDLHNDKYLYSALEQATAVAKNRFG